MISTKKWPGDEEYLNDVNKKVARWRRILNRILQC